MQSNDVSDRNNDEAADDIYASPEVSRNTTEFDAGIIRSLSKHLTGEVATALTQHIGNQTNVVLIEETNNGFVARNVSAAAPVVETCCICLSELKKDTIPIVLPCGHPGHHNCLMGVENKLCPLCRAPIPASLRKRVIVEDDPLEGKEPPLWQYQSRDGRAWWQYLPEHSAAIEEQYQALLGGARGRAATIVHLTIQGKQYQIDLRNMVQVSPEGHSRTIMRREPTDEPENIKGLAGAVPKQL